MSPGARPKANWLRPASAIALFCLAGCHSRDRVHVETDEGPPHLASMLSMGNPEDEPQLLEGFYNMESHSWRWTAGHFSVLLATPPNAADNGAVLRVQLSVPKPVIDRVKTFALAAAVQGKKLTPESFTLSGEYTFLRDVPPNLLTGETARVDFSLDRFLPPGALDPRELGLVVTEIGFEPRATPPPPR